jgi:hypothetical protein
VTSKVSFRAAQLETVAEPRQGERTDLTSGHDGPKLDERTAKRLRSINRAPDIVKDAYREGRISQTLAAKLGPRTQRQRGPRWWRRWA